MLLDFAWRQYGYQDLKGQASTELPTIRRAGKGLLQNPYKVPHRETFVVKLEFRRELNVERRPAAAVFAGVRVVEDKAFSV